MDPCNNLSGVVRPGHGTLLTVRSGRDVLPYRVGPALSTYMVDYIPPVLMPSYNGGLPGVAICFANTGSSATKKNLQTERSDILGNRVVILRAYFS